MKRIRLDLIVLVLSGLLAAFAAGYFTGRTTVVPEGTVTVLTEKTPSASETRAVASNAGNDGDRININTADKAELMSLPGIGETLAERIIAYREETGPFITPEELGEVSGIGEKKLEELLNLVCVGE